MAEQLLGGSLVSGGAQRDSGLTKIYAPSNNLDHWREGGGRHQFPFIHSLVMCGAPLEIIRMLGLIFHFAKLCAAPAAGK